MKRLIGRLAILLSIAAGPFARFDDTSFQPIRNAFQCCFSFQRDVATAPTVPSPVHEDRPAVVPGIRNREALRGLCLINTLPSSQLAAAADSSPTKCPLEFLCAEQREGLASWTIESLVDAAGGAFEWASGKIGVAAEAIGSLHAENLARFTRPAGGEKSLEPVAASHASAPILAGEANGYWDYYSDCDRWGLIFQTVSARDFQSEWSSAPARSDAEFAARFLGWSERIPLLSFRWAKQGVDGLTEVVAEAVSQIRELSHSLVPGGQWVVPTLEGLD